MKIELNLLLQCIICRNNLQIAKVPLDATKYDKLQFQRPFCCPVCHSPEGQYYVSFQSVLTTGNQNETSNYPMH